MIGRGTRRELALCRRALRAAITHLVVARQGLDGTPEKVNPYTRATDLRDSLYDAIDTLNSLGAPMRKGKKP